MSNSERERRQQELQRLFEMRIGAEEELQRWERELVREEQAQAERRAELMRQIDEELRIQARRQEQQRRQNNRRRHRDQQQQNGQNDQQQQNGQNAQQQNGQNEG